MTGTACLDKIPQTERESLETYTALIEAAGKPWPVRIDAVASVRLRPDLRQGGGFWPDASLAPQANAVAQGLALLRSAGVVVAVKRYQLEHSDHRPKRLDDLVPAYLKSIPIDPFSGRPLLFVPEEGGYVVQRRAESA